jgi:predicted Zn-dependent peptidase
MYTKSVLDNGLRVVTSTMPHSRSVCLALLVGTGSCYENEQEAGISHFIEHLYFKGTERRPTAKDISQDIEGVGGIINGSTDKEVTIYWCKVASAHFPLALDVLSDLLLNSRLDSEDMEQERQVIIEEINMEMDFPQRQAGIVIERLLWPDQPLGREVAGTKEAVGSLTRGQIVDYVARCYLPTNTVLGIAGNIRHEEAIAQIEPFFARWAGGQLSTGYISHDKQTAPRLHIQSRDSEQAHLCLAVHGLSLFHPDRFALDMLSAVLGGGMSSRLFTEIREKRGLAYDIHSYAEHFLNSGSIAIYAGVDPKKVETAITAILEELSKLKQGVTPSELSMVKEMSKGRLQLRLEDSQSAALWLGSQEILRRQILTIDDVTSMIDAVTVDDMRRIAGELLVSEQLNLAIVGPVKGEEPLLERLSV